jgi:hypothetical protein
MASNSRRGLGRPPRDARQVDLNFCFGESRLINSEDRDSNKDDAVDGEYGTPDSSEVTMLGNPPKVSLTQIQQQVEYWTSMASHTM